jgi:hypothetical protein
MTHELEKLIRPEEKERMGIDSLTEKQQKALAEWGLRMFSLGQHIVADIQDIKYDGRLIILDDGTRWEVDSVDTMTAELWSAFDKVVVIDDEMFKLDDLQKVSVEEEFE